jgi:hypothetical protein
MYFLFFFFCYVGIKEFACQYCPNKAYYTAGKLNEHKRKHHMAEFLLEQTDKGEDGATNKM